PRRSCTGSSTSASTASSPTGSTSSPPSSPSAATRSRAEQGKLTRDTAGRKYTARVTSSRDTSIPAQGAVEGQLSGAYRVVTASILALVTIIAFESMAVSTV